MRAALKSLVTELYRIRYRLLLVNVLIVSVPLVGVGFARFFEREMLRALEDDMINQARVVREVLRTAPAPVDLTLYESLLQRAARDTRTRIRLLDGQGQLMADSHRDGAPEGPEHPPPALPGLSRPAPDHPPPAKGVALDLANRPEIIAARAGRYGSNTRVWRWQEGPRHASAGERVYLFAALPVTEAGAAPQAIVYVTRSTTPVLTAMHRLRHSLTKLLVIALIATVVLSVFLAGTISRPITRLMRRARALAAGDTRISLDLRRRDEIGDLARTIDAMATRLRERADETAALAANISHEFKSPLTSLRGAAELLLDGAAEDPAARQRFLNNMLEDSKRLDRLVTRLLELSRMEADRSPVEPIDCHQLVREVVRVEGRDHPIELRLHATQVVVSGRRLPLSSALANLLRNALQHARQGTPVIVESYDAPGGLIGLSVHNHGTPIAAADVDRIWTRFFTTRAAGGGTGLGLPIVATVIRSHGGRHGVTSSAADGTRFFVELPTTHAS